MLSKSEVFEAVKAANAAPFVAGRGVGCGRAYVSVGGEKAELTAVAAAAKKERLLCKRHSAYACVYIGYDNADGRAIAKAEAFAAELKARGLKAYVNLRED